MTDMRQHHVYATYRGSEYWLTMLESRSVLLSESKESPGSEWEAYEEVWILPVATPDVDEVVDVQYRGEYRGVPVTVSRTPRGKLMLTTQHTKEAHRVGLVRVDDPYIGLKIVELDDPDLTFREERTTIPFPY